MGLKITSGIGSHALREDSVSSKYNPYVVMNPNYEQQVEIKLRPELIS
jgi:hypothetical protein